MKWRFMTLTHETQSYFIRRMSILNCRGFLDLPLSKTVLDQSYVYHLHHNTAIPFKFSLRGVPVDLDSNADLDEKLNALSEIFVKDLPIPEIEDKKSYFKLVKRESNATSRTNTNSCKEIEAAYPWGFVSYANLKKPKLRKKTRGRNQ
uniref:Uncharacterized protein n=1 Tax=Melanthalia intermedia TaxID=172989 RepID=A0A345UB24_9FLOR|nr:hypothetical protein [Melanthalia intermedia]AXI97660.1 hypothetical protein [Melanthalia intermedia]